MASILDTATQAAQSSWETITGGLERWVGLETQEEVDRLADNTAGDGSATQTYRLTGQAPADDGSPNPAMEGGGMSTLFTLSAVAGIVVAGITVWQYVR